MKKNLLFVKRDKYNMPIYMDKDGEYWIDIDCRKEKPQLYKCRDNDPDDGPDDPIDPNVECTFIPERVKDPVDSQLEIIYFI
jgi:hypothetical protein